MIEPVSDRVGMIRAGKIVFCDALDAIKETHCRMTLRFEKPRAAPPALEGALAWDGAGREWTVLCSGPPGRLEAAAALLGAAGVESPSLTWRLRQLKTKMSRPHSGAARTGPVMEMRSAYRRAPHCR